MLTRREFLQRASASAAAALGVLPCAFARDAARASFVAGDTHYCADDEDITRMDPVSAEYNGRLVEWLNKLPGSEFTEEVGGGVVPAPAGVIHAGDLVDNADKQGAKLKMADTEMAAFVADWGLNGGDGRLRWPVREVHGNHDGPRGETVVVNEIKNRNKRRAGLTEVSENQLHYSWDWGGVHFVALGIVVGGAPEITRRRRYAPFDSLTFLREDLAKHVGKTGKPVVLVHHVDVARYSEAVPDEKAVTQEWDYGDVQAYYATLREYRVAAAICGHTHARNIFRWNGTKDTRAAEGLPFLNTDNAGHFNNLAQGILHVTITDSALQVREFATKDAWVTGTWTPQVWRFDLA